MNRFLMTVAVAVVGLTTLAVAQTRAEGHSGRESGRSYGGESRHESRSGYQYHASRRFDYGRHGYRSFSWTHSYFSSYYGCSCYWAPSYGWCFYEPSYSCYVPVSYYSEVYPEVVPSGPAPVIPAPTTIQQTTVVVAPSAPAIVPDLPPAPAPTAVQQTKVVVASPPTDLPPAPSVVSGPTAVQKTKVGAVGP